MCGLNNKSEIKKHCNQGWQRIDNILKLFQTLGLLILYVMIFYMPLYRPLQHVLIHMYFDAIYTTMQKFRVNTFGITSGIWNISLNDGLYLWHNLHYAKKKQLLHLMSTSTHMLKEKEQILTNCYVMADLKLRSLSLHNLQVCVKPA